MEEISALTGRLSYRCVVTHGTEQVRELSVWFKLRTVVRMDQVT